MFPPPLLASRPPALQMVQAVALPALAGVVGGLLLSADEGAYTIYTLVMILGGVLSGYEHADALEGAGRGVASGMLFGTFILLGHAIAGGRAKAALPDPHVLLPVATTVLGALFAAIGGALRGRRERRASPPAAA